MKRKIYNDLLKWKQNWGGKTAVLIDRGEGSGILSTNVLFYRPQMNIQIAVIVAELSEGSNTAVWFPENVICGQFGNRIPVRYPGYFYNGIGSYISLGRVVYSSRMFGLH